MNGASSNLFFPPGPNGETFGINTGATEAQVNTYTGGWNMDNTTRLLFVNGDFDPWREASVSSDIRPGGPMESTAQVPIDIVPGGFHVSDMVTENGAVNEGVQQVIDEVMQQLVEWVGEWDGGNGGGWGHHHGGPPGKRRSAEQANPRKTVRDGRASKWRA